jgi:hypothetical protein
MRIQAARATAGTRHARRRIGKRKGSSRSKRYVTPTHVRRSGAAAIPDFATLSDIVCPAKALSSSGS